MPDYKSKVLEVLNKDKKIFIPEFLAKYPKLRERNRFREAIQELILSRQYNYHRTSAMFTTNPITGCNYSRTKDGSRNQRLILSFYCMLDNNLVCEISF